jgi:hypothetical protein
MKKLKLPPLELLNHLFEIDENSLSGLIWKNPRANSVKKGAVAGRISNHGYYNVGIRTDKDRNYRVHRIIYYMQTGEDPENFYIDHKGSRCNNLNIRKATPSQNAAYAKKTKSKTTSKYKGVSKNKNRKKWKASLMVNRECVYTDYFDNEIDAAIAYNKKALEYRGEFAVLNNI